MSLNRNVTRICPRLLALNRLSSLITFRTINIVDLVFSENSVFVKGTSPFAHLHAAHLCALGKLQWVHPQVTDVLPMDKTENLIPQCITLIYLQGWSFSRGHWFDWSAVASCIEPND